VTTLPRVSAIVVHYRAEQYLARCLDSLARAAEHIPLETIVVDNASLDDVAAWRERFPGVVWLTEASNRGFASGVNVGLDRATGTYALIQNPDAWLLDGSLEQLVRRLDEAPHVAAVTPQLVDMRGVPQSSGGAAPTLARILLGKATGAPSVHARSRISYAELDWASATALLCRRSALDAVGGMDEGFFLYYEDCDLGVRLRRAGWSIELVSPAQAVHVGGVSFAADSAVQLRAYLMGQNRYFRKHRPPPERLALIVLQSLYRWTGMRRVMTGADR
jgi:N-acetylglucosaminyl-diphospho-decaprenol L-rhamnosyltransferase